MTDFVYRIDPLCSCRHPRSEHYQGNDGFAADCAVVAHGTRCPCSRFGTRKMESPVDAVTNGLQEGEHTMFCQTWLPGGDDLRTRIAAAIYNAYDDYTRKFLVRPDCPGASGLEGDGKPKCYVLADAVIRELQLTVLGDGIVVGAIHE